MQVMLLQLVATEQENNTCFLNNRFIDIACKEVPAVPSTQDQIISHKPSS